MVEETKNTRFSILIVDDDAALSKLVKSNLQDESTQVTEAPDGLSGIRALHDSKVDLVLLDLKLPDFSGWGILSLLRLTRPLQHTRVIVVSMDPPDEKLIGQLKPNDYIQKPFDVRDLLARVRRLRTLASPLQA